MEDDRLPETLPGLDVKAGLDRMGGDGESYLRLLVKFAERQGGAVHAIKELLAKNESAEARHLAHALAGIAGNVGADALHRAARRLEAALRDGNRGESVKAAAEVEERFAETAASIRRLAAGRGTKREAPAGSALPDAAAVRALVARLQTLVEENNAEAKAAFETLEETLRGTAWAPRLAPIGKCLEEYDFDGALAAIAGLRTEGDG